MQSHPRPSVAPSASKGVTLADLHGGTDPSAMPSASQYVVRAPAPRSGAQRQRADQDQERAQLLRSSIYASLERSARGVPLTDPEAADNLDNDDVLRGFRKRFFIPAYDSPDREECVYFCGNSLGLLPCNGRQYILDELDKWAQLGVQGHFNGDRPWANIDEHQHIRDASAAIVGAQRSEVVVMNTLTCNLHMMMAAFYRPTGTRFKILIEDHAFGSDQYAVTSHLEHHNQDPTSALVRIKPRDGEETLRTEDIISVINAHGSDIALVMLSGVQYFTGQLFDIEAITQAGHAVGAKVGWDLAHAAGNVPLKLHEWDVDFACWCTYKYLNSGPGACGGVFVHDKHTAEGSGLKYFKGWWGHNADSRFQMLDDFDPALGAARFQLSNPPMLPMVSIIASLELFEEAGFERLRAKSEQLTMYLETLLKAMLPSGVCEILTPSAPHHRGCQLSLRLPVDAADMEERLLAQGITVDARRPNVIRVAPTPMYNSFKDVHVFVTALRDELKC